MHWTEDLGIDSRRHRKVSRCPVLKLDPSSPRARFAPYRGRRTCRSRAGRWRPRHEFVGGACLFCDAAPPLAWRLVS